MAISFEEASLILKAGGIVVYPTETLYGLGCKLEEGPICRLKKLKGRDAGKPILIAVPSVAAIGKYAFVPKKAKKFLSRILPGPVSVILRKKKSVPDSLTGKSPFVGIRVPQNALARKLAAVCGAITSTSANKAGEKPAVSYAEASSLGLFTVLKGECKYKRPSTVFDVATGKVLREGAVPSENLYRAWGESLER